MSAQTNAQKYAGIGDEALRAKTGKGWADWFAILDEAHATSMSHKQMVAFLSEHFGVPGWWRQQIVVGYEQARGLREKHQKPEGYEISKSKTLSAPLDVIYQAWFDDSRRQHWLGEIPLELRKANTRKNIRFTFSDGATIINVQFYPKGEKKTQVVVQHSKLANAETAEKMKGLWTEALNKLKQVVETIP